MARRGGTRYSTLDTVMTTDQNGCLDRGPDGHWDRQENVYEQGQAFESDAYDLHNRYGVTGVISHE